MIRAQSILPQCDWSAHAAADVITLDYDARHRRRIVLVADGGTAFLLDLARAAVLLDGDALALDDGRLIRVRAADEPVMRVTAGADTGLARLAWHIGNRHLPAALHDDHLLLREDHVIAAMLEGLGAHVAHIRAPFTPEQGAYSGAGHAPEHGHGHDGDEGGHHHRHHNHAH